MKTVKKVFILVAAVSEVARAWRPSAGGSWSAIWDSSRQVFLRSGDLDHLNVSMIGTVPFVC